MYCITIEICDIALFAFLNRIQLPSLIILIKIVTIGFTNKMVFVITKLQVVKPRPQAAGRDLRLVIVYVNAEALGRGINM